MCASKSVKSIKVDRVAVKIYDSAVTMGQVAAEHVAHRLQATIEKKGQANLILSTGASQFTFLEALKNERAIDWSKISVFHLDEYKGMSARHPASFRKYLRERILDEVKPARVYLLEGDAMDIEAEIDRYEKLLRRYPIDIACIGIGENGHIAFNDPGVADFNDPSLVKVVELDEACRQQQLGEGWFATLEDVPKEALTLTITAIMNSKTIICVVPEKRKAEAVHDALRGTISTACPASILRKHTDVSLFLDSQSSMALE